MALRFSLAAVTLCVITAVNAAPLSQRDADRVRHSDAVRIALQTLEAHTSDVGAYSVALAQLAGTLDLTSAEREAALYAGTLRLAALPPNNDARRLLAELATRPVLLSVRVEDGHGHHTTPLYDVAAAARYVERRWQIRVHSDEASARLKTYAPLAADSRKAMSNEAVAAGIDMAMRKASLDELRAQRATLLAALPFDPLLGSAALTAARRLGDAGLLESVVRHGDENSARGAIDATRDLTDGDALAVVSTALERKATASTAVFALGERYASSPAAARLLMTLIEDRRLGGSAAAALARLDDPALANRLADKLATTSDAMVAARLALALCLMQNDAALRRLDEFARTPGAHTELKATLSERRR